MTTLKAQKRESGKAKATREAGLLPAVVYGRNEASQSVAVPFVDFLKAYEEAGESSVIVLEGLGETKNVLVHDLVRDAVSGKPIHVDFYTFEKGQKVTVAVPLEFSGVSAAMKDEGGVLVKVLYEIEVEAEPSALPHAIVVDLSQLATLDSQIHVRDLALPKGVTAELDPDEVVAMITVAEEEKEEPTMDISQIEVEKKGKKEEEAAEAAA